MPVKIYWGPPGSYKTASAVWEDVTACAAQGRVLITNVRGLSEERCATHLPNVAQGFQVIHLRMDKPDELARLRRWWHWAPFGAYFVLDETQAIYPPNWTDARVRELDMPADMDRRFPNGETMPKDMALAFDMHRHGNWDFTFTTPNIKKVRPEIRATAEWAYKHRNLNFTVIWSGQHMQFQHGAEDNGNPSDIYLERRRKVPKYVYDLYDSTGTGTAKDSAAGGSIFKSGKFLFLAASIIALLLFVVLRDPPQAIKAAYGVPAPGPNSRAPASERTDFRADSQGVRSGAVVAPSPDFEPVPVDPGPASAPQPSPAASPVPSAAPAESKRWRLLGVLSSSKGVYALLGDGSARRRVRSDQCRVTDGLNEFECVVEGELIAAWTGGDAFGIELLPDLDTSSGEQTERP